MSSVTVPGQSGFLLLHSSCLSLESRAGAPRVAEVLGLLRGLCLPSI